MRGRLTFSLSSLMLVVACAAIASSLAAASPVLGIAFALLAVPAVARTAALLRREADHLENPAATSVKSRIFTFCESLILLAYGAVVSAVATIFCGAAGFFLGALTCAAFASNDFTQLEAGALTGMIVGPAAGLVVFALHLRAYWSRRQF